MLQQSANWWVQLECWIALMVNKWFFFLVERERGVGCKEIAYSLFALFCFVYFLLNRNYKHVREYRAYPYLHILCWLPVIDWTPFFFFLVWADMTGLIYAVLDHRTKWLFIMLKYLLFPETEKHLWCLWGNMLSLPIIQTSAMYHSQNMT